MYSHECTLDAVREIPAFRERREGSRECPEARKYDQRRTRNDARGICGLEATHTTIRERTWLPFMLGALRRRAAAQPRVSDDYGLRRNGG